jgi:hypothetical protein
MHLLLQIVMALFAAYWAAMMFRAAHKGRENLFLVSFVLLVLNVGFLMASFV